MAGGAPMAGSIWQRHARELERRQLLYSHMFKEAVDAANRCQSGAADVARADGAREAHGDRLRHPDGHIQDPEPAEVEDRDRAQ